MGGLLFNVSPLARWRASASRETIPHQKPIVGQKIIHERKTFVK
nr:MAG TPA: hypothetical protein [Caudoviricetes sp.]